MENKWLYADLISQHKKTRFDYIGFIAQLLAIVVYAGIGYILLVLIMAIN